MREILFRGKTKFGEWVYGSLILADNYCCILQSVDDVHPLDYPYLNGVMGTIDGEATPVIPETVGQFTGLLDKNGTKIFEGDIMTIGYTGMVRSVVFNDDAEFEFNDRDTSLNVDGICLCADHAGCEVVSNIHEGKTYTVEVKK